MKILKNSTYRELTNAKEQTEAQLSELQSRYDFIVTENKRLHLKNELLHVEIKTLSDKAKKYDIYLQKSKDRKAKAYIKKMSHEKMAKKFLGTEILYRDGTPGVICGYTENFVILGLENEIEHKSFFYIDENDHILKEYPHYVYFNKLEVSKQLTTQKK